MSRSRFRSFALAGVGLAAAGALWSGTSSFSAGPGAAGGLFIGEAHAAERAVLVPAPRVDAAEKGRRAVAVFAGGCFWGVEGVFEHVKGVSSAASGYHGGKKSTADYTLVSAGKTNHAEAVRVVYDPSVVSYGDLMRVYFSVITDPTTLNAQGPDRGRHYRSALVPLNAAQAKAARAYIAQLSKGGHWKRPIVTKIEGYKAFYPAEKYHQNFMQKNPRHGYIRRWDAPKVANLKRHYPAMYRASPVT